MLVLEGSFWLLCGDESGGTRLEAGGTARRLPKESKQEGSWVQGKEEVVRWGEADGFERQRGGGAVVFGNGQELRAQERGQWGIAPVLLTWATKVETILRERGGLFDEQEDALVLFCFLKLLCRKVHPS